MRWNPEMTEAVAEAEAAPAPARVVDESARHVRPPRVLLYAATLVAIALALDASSRASIDALVIGALLWLAIAGVWYVRFLVAVADRRRTIARDAWVRWLAIPVVLGLTLAIARTDAPADARFTLSRGPLDAMAADVLAGGSTDRGIVGLYLVGEVERLNTGIRFVVADNLLGRHGLAYAPAGEPELGDANFSPLWTGATFEPLGEGWWIWYESWD
jgi:hypothetical protein